MSIHAKSVARDKELRIQQGMHRLAQTVDDLGLLGKSRTLIDVFDIIKARSDQILALLQ